MERENTENVNALKREGNCVIQSSSIAKKKFFHKILTSFFSHTHLSLKAMGDCRLRDHWTCWKKDWMDFYVSHN